MGIPGSANFLLAGGGAPAYEIEQSLRFDGSSYLYRTNSGTGSRDIYTFSFWVKRAALGGNHTIWSVDGEANSQQTSGHDIRFVNGSSYATNDELIFSSYIRPLRATTGVQRDPSAWAHYVIAVDTTQATQNDRIKMWVNGDSTITDAINTGYWPGQNQDTTPNRSGDPVEIGRNTRSSSEYGNFYLAEFHYVDGTAYDETSFGEYDDNGVWRPIEVSGLSYGTNGWYMKFDETATNGIGHDHSGNGNNFTASGFTTNSTFPNGDVVYDTPTNNYSVIQRHEIYNASYLSDGNLKVTTPGTSGFATFSSIAMPSTGKYYWEVKYTSISEAGIGLRTRNPSMSTFELYYRADGRLYNNGTTTQNWATTWTTTDVMGMYYDCSTKVLGFTKNGTDVGVTVTVNSDATLFSYGQAYGGDVSVWNFGQQDFQYTPPSGYLPLNTANLPAPDIADGSQHFEAITYTGDGNSTQQITTSFEPDFVWSKIRNQGYYHRVFDRLRGTLDKALYTPETFTEDSITDYGEITATSSTSVTIGQGGDSGNLINASGNTGVLWNWKAGGSGSSNTSGSITSTVSANTTSRFSIVAYTGNGNSAATVGHGLGVTPNFVILKRRTGGIANWQVGEDGSFGSKELYLNTTNSYTDGANEFSVTSTVIDLNSSHFGSNASGSTYVAYCFAEVEGYSKFGSYTGNSNADGPFVYCGFRPAFVLIKSKTSGENWHIKDSSRGSYNPMAATLFANLSNSESNLTNSIDFLSNGFKIRSNSWSGENSSNTFIFAAFAEHPFGGSGISPATAR